MELNDKHIHKCSNKVLSATFLNMFIKMHLSASQH